MYTIIINSKKFLNLQIRLGAHFVSYGWLSPHLGNATACVGKRKWLSSAHVCKCTRTCARMREYEKAIIMYRECENVRIRDENFSYSHPQNLSHFRLLAVQLSLSHVLAFSVYSSRVLAIEILRSHPVVPVARLRDGTSQPPYLKLCASIACV